jgi:dolichol-phosphate mannosyltransferase
MINILNKNLKMKYYNLSVVIPVFNNPEDIKPLLKNFKKSGIKNILICFVDDSSDERTINQINQYFTKNFIIFKGPNKKNGRNIAIHYVFKWLIKNINTKFIAEFDSDNSYRFLDLKDGVKKIKNYDMAIGSKFLENSKINNRPIVRNFISFITSFICSNLFDNKILDYTNAQRIYSINFYKKILKKKIAYESPLENLNVLLYAIKIKGKIIEYPSWYLGNNKSHWYKDYFYLLKTSFKTIKLILFYFVFIYLKK